MRISFMPITNVLNHNSHIQTFVSKVDKRIALIATLIFATIVFLAYQYSKRKPIISPQLEKKDIEKKDDIVELQKKYPGQRILTDNDFVEALKANKIWMVIHGKVYDVTPFIEQHPGGAEVLIDNNGRDASQDFIDMGHSDEAKQMMQDYYIGVYGGEKFKK